MNEIFQSDEIKKYEESYRSKENARAEECFRSAELYRASEFNAVEIEANRARNEARRKRMRRERSLIGTLVTAVGSAAGAVVIVAAVILMSLVQVTLLSFAATMDSLQFRFRLEQPEGTSLTACLSAGGERLEAALPSGEGEYVLSFDALTEDTEYLLEVSDQDGNIHFSGVYRTQAAPLRPLLLSEQVTADGISLFFDEATLSESGYIILVNGVEQDFRLSASSPSVVLPGLSPETTYRIAARHPDTGETVFEGAYTTLAETHVVAVSQTFANATETTLEVGLLVEHADGLSLRAYLVGGGEQREETVTAGEQTLRFDALSPDTEYLLEVRGEDGTVCFSHSYRTAAAASQLTLIGETVLSESISLAFDGGQIFDVYRFFLDGEEKGTIDAERAEIAFDGLQSDTEYRVSAIDSLGKTVFEKTYRTALAPLAVEQLWADATMTTLSVGLSVNRSDVALTARLSDGQTRAFPADNNVWFGGLAPDTPYTLELIDSEGNVYFAQTYRTRAYEQKLFPEETISSDSIVLKFDEAELTSDDYSVLLDGAAFGNLTPAQPILLISDLVSEMNYRVTIVDGVGDTVFDKTYTTVSALSLTELSAETKMTTVRLSLEVRDMEVPLTVSLGLQSFALHEGINEIEFTGLSPNAPYAVRVKDEEGNEYFFRTYRTQAYVQTLFPVESYIGTDTIFLQFDEADIPEEGYEVSVDGVQGRLLPDNPMIVLDGLDSRTEHFVSVSDGMGDLLFDESYTTEFLIADLSDFVCTPTFIEFNLWLDMPRGQARLELTDAEGALQEYRVLYPGDGGEIIFENLTPMEDYTLILKDDYGTIYYDETIRTTLSPTLVSLSGTQLTLTFPVGQFGSAIPGSAQLYLDGQATGNWLPSEVEQVTLQNLTPNTTYALSVVSGSQVWWQENYTTPAITVDGADLIVGSTEVHAVFTVQNPQNEPLKVALVMGDQEIDSLSFGTQTDFVASFETIPNGFYLVRLVRESDGLILWEEAALTDRSYIEVLGTVSLSETEDGEELWVISAAQAGNAEFRVSSVGQYTAESALRDGSGTLTPSVSADGGATVFSYEAAAIGTGAVYEFRLYREEGGEQYLVERLYWMYG